MILILRHCQRITKLDYKMFTGVNIGMMPQSGGLAERLLMLEKNMLGPEDKPFDEELFNMMKVHIY